MVSYRGVLGKSVVSLADGAEVGEVRRVIVDSSQGRVVALAVEGPHWWLACPVVMLADVVGIAADTLTVKEQASLFDVSERPGFVKFLQGERPLIGRRVLLTSGADAGEVRGFEFASPSGEIKALEVASADADGPSQRLLAEHIASFGCDVVVAQDEAMGEAPVAAANVVAPEVAAQPSPAPAPSPAPTPSPAPAPSPPPSVAAAPADLAGTATVAASPVGDESPPAVVEPPAPAVAQGGAQPEVTGFVPLAKSDFTAEAKLKLAAPPAPEPAPEAAEQALPPAPAQQNALVQQNAPAQPPTAAEAAAPVQPSAPVGGGPEQNGGVTTGADLAQLFRERQERFLLGKTAQRQVRDDEGQVIVAAGDEIAPETLEKVKQAGKLLDLTASVSLKR